MNFIVNGGEGELRPGVCARARPSVCAIAFRVKNAGAAYKRALSLGAWGVEGKVGPMELNIPAIKGIGDLLLYLVDRYGDRGSIHDVDFDYLPGVDRNPTGVGLTYIDHLTHKAHAALVVAGSGGEFVEDCVSGGLVDQMLFDGAGEHAEERFVRRALQDVVAVFLDVVGELRVAGGAGGVSMSPSLRVPFGMLPPLSTCAGTNTAHTGAVPRSGSRRARPAAASPERMPVGVLSQPESTYAA